MRQIINKLGEGGYGGVFEVKAPPTESGDVKSMVLKEFRSQKQSTPAESAQKAYQNYQMAKEAGLRVLDTYQLSEDGTSILMPNANDEKHVCVGLQSKERKQQRAEFLEQNKLKVITNLDDLCGELEIDARKAAHASILLNHDCLFFLINKINWKEVNYIIGDMDELKKTDLRECDLLKENVTILLEALLDFISRFVEEPSRKKYIRYIRIRIENTLNDSTSTDSAPGAPNRGRKIYYLD